MQAHIKSLKWNEGEKAGEDQKSHLYIWNSEQRAQGKVKWMPPNKRVMASLIKKGRAEADCFPRRRGNGRQMWAKRRPHQWWRLRHRQCWGRERKKKRQRGCIAFWKTKAYFGLDKIHVKRVQGTKTVWGTILEIEISTHCENSAASAITSLRNFESPPCTVCVDQPWPIILHLAVNWVTWLTVQQRIIVLHLLARNGRILGNLSPLRPWVRNWTVNCVFRCLLDLQMSTKFPVLYHARVIPYGMHGMGGGFHEMGMDSMEWGMDSILFPWNGGWNPWTFQMDSIPFPWNGGWTPYFFKMDSMGWGMDSMLF